MGKIKSRRRTRIEIIQVLYKFELFNEPINLVEVFDNYDFLDQIQIKKIESISKNYNFLKTSLVSLVNQSWSWDRISPLTRAIIINGASECFYLQPRIVFNEAVEIAKLFFEPTEIKDENGEIINKHDSKQYKFVNAILQNFYKLLVNMEAKSSHENA
ncbi:transcription antitermination protein NusB [Mycoplasmopsis citelli]|uniref:Transcription termination factor n=1 Tax=Mycoplasmopsis citelli TaxID=171281 RepID=A0A449B0V8_9BACT|nr:transcription antitermination factor NusB [Mycoplasmopsis citelli]UUD36607.1 transcription antitermination protein NusB [Mycoplasmopsis citelli]VEU74248.1 transcription termination factor [Mycoplasmopsis citelli]